MHNIQGRINLHMSTGEKIDNHEKKINHSYNLLIHVIRQELKPQLFIFGILVSCYLVYPASKPSMTIRHCFQHADLVSYPSFYISSNIFVSLRNLIFFSTSQIFALVSLCHPGYCISFCGPSIEGSFVMFYC